MDTPNPGTREYAKAIQDDFQAMVKEFEEKWGGQIWRYCSLLFEAHAPEGNTFACTSYSVGYEINVINGFVKWMDEAANHKMKQGLTDDPIDEMKRLLSVTHAAIIAPAWQFKTDEIDPDEIKMFIGTALPDNPPA